MRRKVAYTSRLKEGSPGEEQGESAATEAAEIKTGTDATPAGPTTTGAATKPIPHAGTGATAGSAAGGPGPHPQNLVAPTRAGSGQGAPGGRAIERPQDKAKPAKAVATPLPVDPKKARRTPPPKDAKGSNRFTGGQRTNLGHFLGKVAKGTGRPA